jgi:3-isopropylmalate dehydrogenase
MFDWLGETESARRLESAVAAVILDQKVGTYDVGLSHTTLEVAQEVARKVTAAAPAQA